MRAPGPLILSHVGGYETQNYFFRRGWCDQEFLWKIFFNEFFCFSVIMSKKASADQFSVSGVNLGQNRTRKTVFLCGKDFFLGGSSYVLTKIQFVILVRKWDFMVNSTRTVLWAHSDVAKHFGCSKSSGFIISDYVGKQNSSHFIQGIPPALCWQKSVCSYWCRNEFLSPHDSNFR